MTASTGAVAAFLVAWVAGARCVSIDCEETGESLVTRHCQYDRVCTVHCKSPCLTDSRARVFGTVYYSQESSICKSALHDLRISSWNSSAWAVSLSLQNEHRGDFAGSLRYGVTSDSSFSSKGYFQFTSPRIKEEVLDVTALHRDFIYTKYVPSKLECHGPRDRPVAFNYTIRQVGFQNVNLRPHPVNGTYFLTLSIGEFAHARTNMFWCLVQGSTLSSIGSPAMYYGSDGNPTFLPENYTVTASLADSVALRVQSVDGGSTTPTVTSWATLDAKGRTKTLASSGGKSEWSIRRVDLRNSGVYVANGPNRHSPGKNRAVFRVIVRTCKHDVYGPECNYNCPTCQNGGVCHDITGQCICPPGFRGQLCENPCGDDFFGRECQYRCSDTNPDGKVTSCRGIMMCLPDPYGCSCGTGFHGPFCNETCPPHTYGADCKQSRICFCKTEQFCDIHTGTCRRDRGDCRQGWKTGPYCDISYPLLKRSPLVWSVSDTEATIAFRAWNKNRDEGEGKPKEYRIEFKVANESWSAQTVAAVHGKRTYRHPLKELRSGKDYEARVLVVDQDGNYREHGVVAATFKTACETPRMPPENVSIHSNTSCEIIVRWKNPDREDWLCSSISVVFEIDGKSEELNLTQRGPTPMDVYRIQVKDCEPRSIRLRFRTADNKYSPWTKMYTGIPAQGAPSMVEHIELKQVGSRAVLLSWDPPMDANGILRHYWIRYLPLAFRISGCGALDHRAVEVYLPASHTTVNLTSLRPYSKYQISVAAVTIRPGPASNVTFHTTAAVPEGAATNFYHSQPAVGEDTLTWFPVPCDLANGVISSYYLELESKDPWENKPRNTTVPLNYFTYKDLVPYTRYHAKVFAENEAGRSPRDASLIFTTAAADPVAPVKLEADLRSQDSVLLSWNAPYPPRGVLSHYQLKYFNATERSQYTERVISHTECGRTDEFRLEHCHTVEGLETSEVYIFTVRAKNEGTGYSPYSEEVKVETTEMAPGAPVNIRSTEVTEDSLKIEWEPPMRRNGLLLQYQVHSRIIHTFNAMLVGSWNSTPITLPTSGTLEVNLPDLFPGSTYEVCIQASTVAGFGEAVCGNFSTKSSVPIVEKEPVVGRIFNNSVNVRLTPIDFVKGPVTAYYLLVVREGENIDEPLKLVNFSTAEDMRQGYYVAAHLTPDQLEEGPVNFVVGSGKGTEHFENPPLTDTTPYRFGFVAESDFGGDVFHGYRLSAPVIVNRSGPAADVGAIIGGIAGVLIVIIVAGLFTRYHFTKKADVQYHSNIPRMRVLKENLTRFSKLKENSMSESRRTLMMESGEYLHMASIPNRGLPSKPVPVRRLRQHVIEGAAQGILKEEYMNLPRGQLHSWEVATEPQNKPKNRDESKLPYDHSRVILAPSAPGDSSDYINASYVWGYKNPQKYIAAQGPEESTLVDFWRMVWQQGSWKIVMLTNLKEEQNTKCSQYWPETSQKYGNITVTLMKTDTHVDFVVREFQLALEDRTRTVVQFHFTTWPDHGLPRHPPALQPFLKRIRDFLPLDGHPIIVHCSDGIGRTGAFILVDSMLSQAEAESEVDLVAQLHAMRQSRVDLVDSLELYYFVYNILVDVLCSKNHNMSVEEFVRLYPKLEAKFPATGKSAFDLEFEDLSRVCAPPGPENLRSARDARNTSKNRSSKILAGDSRRPLLRVTADGLKTDYINAVYVYGFKRSNAYLVTQLPLLETICDFWEMLAGSGAVTFVTLGPLDDETVAPIFWPDLKCAARYGDVTVEQKGTQDYQDLVVRTFLLTKSLGPPRIVKQFHFESWQRHRNVPSSATIVLEILEHVERWQMQGEGTPVVVQCLDGCQQSGLYCVSSAICDQLKLEKELDVFRAVRNARASRVEFIVDSEQYAFCYEVALACVDSLHMYCNVE